MVYSPQNQWTFPVNTNFPWLPAVNDIVSISNSNPAIIVTKTNHGYSSGFNVRIVYPFLYSNSFGMPQINGMSGIITVISSTSFSIDIDTTLFDIFSIGTTYQNPQVIPIGQTTNSDLNDSMQVNPVNNQKLSDVKIFQSSGLQAPGPCNTSQT